MVITRTTSLRHTPTAILLLPVYVQSIFFLFMLTPKYEWEDTESTSGSHRKSKEGGVSLSEHFQHTVAISGEVSDDLIDAEFSSQPATVNQSSTWSEVAGTKSWHTSTVASSSGHDNRFGRPGSTSVTGSLHSFNSDIAERSQSGRDDIEMRNGFAKIRAQVSRTSSLKKNIAGFATISKPS